MANLITVIIPVHNMADSLAYAIDSAHDADRIILVDDASSDNSEAIIHGAVKTYRRVQSYRTGSPLPAGVCHARNLAIAHADVDSLIVPLDADDELLPGWRDTYERARAGVCVYANWRESSQGGLVVRDVSAPPPGMLNRKDIARGLCFHRDDWLRAGGYNPLFNIGGEDYAFMRGLVYAGVVLEHVPTLCYKYTVGKQGRAYYSGREWPLIKKLVEDVYGQVHPVAER